MNDSLPFASNVLQRLGSTRNAVTKDMMRIYGPKWTKKNEARKKEIFKNLFKEGHCNYCGTMTKEKHLLEHFIPTNNSKLQLYGAENEGNIFVSCAPCNKSKHNHHPISWMKGEVNSKNSRPYTYQKEERLYKFIVFYEKFKYKLKANKKLIKKVEEMHSFAKEKHNELHNLIISNERERTL